MQFEKLTINHKDLYIKYWEKCPQKTADYIFSNLLLWNDYYEFQICEAENLIWICTHSSLWAPVGDWESIDFTKIEFINIHKDEGIHFARVPERLKEILEKQFEGSITSEEDRNNGEYVYNQQDLALLKGNRFHKKKNHVNNYSKNYGVDYRSFSMKDATIPYADDVIALHTSWCNTNACDMTKNLKTEFEAVQSIFDNPEYYENIVGGILYADGEPTAFALGEKLDSNTFVVHFEKAHPNYKAAFQAINKYFAENAAEGFQFVNREQDLGDEGQRKAKESYHPSHLLRKYTITIH